MRGGEKQRQLQEKRSDGGWNEYTGKTEDNSTNREDRRDEVSEKQRREETATCHLSPRHTKANTAQCITAHKLPMTVPLQECMRTNQHTSAGTN